MSACEWCGGPISLKPPGTPGLQRTKFCSDNCRKRSFDDRKDRSPAGRRGCDNAACSALRGRGTARPGIAAGYCEGCVHAIADVRRTLAEGMWADGWLLREMAAAFGGVTKAYFSVMRANRGWDLPHRLPHPRRQTV
jgi:hypothetical protein